MDRPTKKVATNGTMPPYACSPLAIAPIACSRTPNRIYVPAYVPNFVLGGWKSVLPLTLVKLLPVKSALPPNKSGNAGLIAVRTISLNFLLAWAASLALYIGKAFSQPLGSWPEIRRVSSACSLGYFLQ